MPTYAIWILAARPKTWIASLSPVFIGTLLAVHQGFFDTCLFVMTLLTGLGIQIITNFANDYFDFIKKADTLERKGPLRVTQAGLVTPCQMKKGIFLAFILTSISGLWLIYSGGYILGILLVLSLIFAIAYTGGPFPLAYLGLGEIFVLLFFGFAATTGTHYLQTGIWSQDALIASLGPGSLSTALLILNNLRDVEEDKKAHKRTLVVRFGIPFGKFEYIAMLLISLVPLAYFTPTHPWIGLTALSFLILLRSNSRFEQTGQLLWLYTCLFCIGWYL